MVDLTLPVERAPLAVVDVETTGLWAEQGDRVCEVAVLRLDGRGGESLFSNLVNPGRPIDRDASRVNGLRDEDVTLAPRFRDLVPRLDELLSDVVLVAHNAPFDSAFLVAEYAIARMPPPDVPVLDTLELSRRLFRFRRNDLASVAVQLGVPLAGTRHRAADDVRTTYQVLLRMAEELAGRGLDNVGKLLVAQGRVVSLRPPRPDGLPEPLAQAIGQRRPITICYVDAGGNASERVVEPLWANRSYLIAFCRAKRAQRTFRLDRIVDAWLA